MSNLAEVNRLLKEAQQELQKEQLIVEERSSRLSSIQSTVEEIKEMITQQMENETLMGKQPFIKMLNYLDSILFDLTNIRKLF
jgi:hypothetical protein